MVNILLIFPFILSFLITLFLMPFWIRKSRELGLTWEDMNKSYDKKISGSGGIVVLLGFIVGVLFYVGYRVFYLGSHNNFLIEIFALLVSVILLTLLGFVDDLLGWKKNGLSRRSRLILILLASVPLIAINAGRSDVSLPFLGNVDLGFLYPLFLIPLGIVGVTTTFNFLAGFNGLEAGQGILLLSALGFVAFFTGSPWITVIALVMVASLTAFLIYNFYPSKVFPGDSLTYSVGGLIAILAILGNFEKIAAFFFIPVIFELFLKLRGRLAKYSFGSPNKDGSLDLRYKKIYSLNHLSILILKKFGIKSTEKRVVYLIWSFQLLMIIIGILIFRQGIFT